MAKETKTIALECRTWVELKERKQQKPNGDWETFAELVARLLKESQKGGMMKNGKKSTK